MTIRFLMLLLAATASVGAVASLLLCLSVIAQPRSLL
jgi:hypothetical protein